MTEDIIIKIEARSMNLFTADREKGLSESQELIQQRNRSNVCIIEFLEKKKEDETERIFKEIMVQNFPNLAEDISTDSKVNPK